MLMVRAPQSKFRLVVEDITHRIASGTMAEGEALPSVREIAEEHGISPSTVERAIPVLEDRGLIFGHAGKARWVCDGAQRRALERLARDASDDPERCEEDTR